MRRKTVAPVDHKTITRIIALGVESKASVPRLADTAMRIYVAAET